LKFDIDKVMNHTAGNTRPLRALFCASENDGLFAADRVSRALQLNGNKAM